MEWTRQPVCEAHHSYDIISDGVLDRKDFAFVFSNADMVKHIPAYTTSTINVYADVVLDSGVLGYLSKLGVSLNVFDKCQRYLGTYRPASTMGSASLVMGQCKLRSDEVKHLEVARVFEQEFVDGMLTVINRQYKNYRKDELLKQRDSLQEIQNRMKTAGSINQLMLLEARARQNYYLVYSLFIRNKDFDFHGRMKNPPTDSVNAMISYGNAILYNRISEEIYRSGLDNRIGLIHSSDRRYESLNLDFADIFKPAIVDTTVLKLINKRQISVTDFDQDGEAVYLGRNGKAMMIEEIDRKLQDKRDGMSYHAIIRQKIARFKRMVEKEG